MTISKKPNVLTALSMVMLLAAAMIWQWQKGIEGLLGGAGVTGPEALVLLSPIVQLVGGLVLMFFRDSAEPTEVEDAWRIAETQIDEEKKSYDTAGLGEAGARIDRKELIVGRFESRLKLARDYAGFGSLSLGFVLRLLALNSGWAIPVAYAAVALFVSALGFLALRQLWPRYRERAWSWAVDVHGRDRVPTT